MVSALYAGDQKTVKAKAPSGPLLPKTGIKTPGTQIPFADLKAEAELPAPDKPTWLFFNQSVYAPAKDHLDKIDARANKVGDPVKDVAKPCGGMVSAFNSLWAADCGNGSLLRMDSRSLKVTATIPSGTSDRKGTIAASGDSVWILSDNKTTLSRIDPDQNAVVQEFRVYPDCGNLTFGETSLWLTCPSENKVLRINPATSLVDKTIEVSAKPEAIAIGETSVWVLCAKDGKVDRIDPKTNKVSKTIDLGVPGAEGQLTIGDGSVWVTMTGFPLTRIDPTAETVAQQFYGEGGGAILFSAGQSPAIWLSNLNNGTLWRIDPKRVLATLAE
jgi:virginiamycin B lyase